MNALSYIKQQQPHHESQSVKMTRSQSEFKVKTTCLKRGKTRDTHPHLTDRKGGASFLDQSESIMVQTNAIPSYDRHSSDNCSFFVTHSNLENVRTQTSSSRSHRLTKASALPVAKYLFKIQSKSQVIALFFFS